MDDKGKKPMLGLLIGMGKPKGKYDDGEDDESMESKGEAELMAVKGFRKAISSGDDEAALDAFKTLMDACYPDLEESGESEPESEDDEEPGKGMMMGK